MNKCKVCGSKMIQLFSSWGCPNDCKGDTPLETPDVKENRLDKLECCEEPGYQKAMKETLKYPSKCVEGNEIAKEKEEQKQKMLKALANFNTMASNLINGMTNMREALDDISIAVGKMGEEMANLHVPDELYRQEYKCDFTCDIEPVPMPSIMNQAINAEAHRLMQEQEQKMMEMLGIPRRLLGKGIYNEVD